MAPGVVPRGGADMASRACPLWDRAGDDHTTHPPDAARAERVLTEWRDLVADDDDRFARRLGWDQLTTRTAGKLTGGVAASSADARWSDALRDAYGATPDAVQAAFAEADSAGLVAPDEPLTFEELFVPLVQYARRQLATLAPVDVLSVELQRSLEFFQETGLRYQSRMNAVLRSHMDHTVAAPKRAGSHERALKLSKDRDREWEREFSPPSLPHHRACGSASGGSNG